jgi:type IV pilus assembly protein PilN
MAGINLLPWRQERRKRQQRNFAIITGGALAVTALSMLGVRANINDRIEYQQQRNQFLTNELTVLDQKIKEIQELEKQKKSLIARMGVIQKLQVSRPEAVHFFDELAKTVPEGVQLIDLTQTDRVIALNGIAQSNARVSVYMRNLDISPWFQEPSLLVIEASPVGKEKKDRQMSRFSLKVTQTEESQEATVQPLKGGRAKP